MVSKRQDTTDDTNVQGKGQNNLTINESLNQLV